jgi:ABC-2 type transport system ATP-binding protein
VIHVSQLTKYYGDYAAIRDVSFDVARGQIVGFLGPNGAGKSTTMRILAGYLNATSGRAEIDGYDVFLQPIEVRRRIGYMPENCPLYPEMRVREYLHFRAGIKGICGEPRRSRIHYVIQRCWLSDVQRQLIGTLSKGYRQRVGLADTLLADPAVLILDEPTAGLDPTQIRETRKLIHELGQEHTLLLSTHILHEVEMTCDHAIIIHKGQVAAAGPIEQLKREAGSETVILVEASGPVDLEPLRAIEEIREVESESYGERTRIRVTTMQPDEMTRRICALSVVHGWQVREVRPHGRTLEDLFVRITSDFEPAAPSKAEKTDKLTDSQLIAELPTEDDFVVPPECRESKSDSALEL